MSELHKWKRSAKRIIYKNNIKKKSTKNRGFQSGKNNKKANENNELQYKHTVIPDPIITQIKKIKVTAITRFFISNSNHQFQNVYKLRVEKQKTSIILYRQCKEQCEKISAKT